MAKRPPAEQPIPDFPTTQRAYTLRLRSADDDAKEWKDALWTTHETINKGARAFGDWLLSLRGGLSHELAEPPLPAKREPVDQSSSFNARKTRRVLLALSWLSVEDEAGAPVGAVRVATGRDADSVRSERLSAALRLILVGRGVGKSELASWLADCEHSLAASIREDAVWVNRSECFDRLAKTHTGLTRKYADDSVMNFFGPAEEYFALPDTQADDEVSGGGSGSTGPEFRTLARQWASTNFGTGEKSDNDSIIAGLRSLARADYARFVGTNKAAFIAHLSKKLGGPTPDIDGVRIAIGWKTGRPSKGRMAIDSLPERLTKASLDSMSTKFAEEADAKQASAGLREVPKWMPMLRSQIETNSGMPFVGDRNHIGEFSVMLDHAARRVSIGHSWIKRAESERQRFEEDATRLNEVPPDASAWLDTYVVTRTGTSGAGVAGGEYRIRRRAIEGWEQVLNRWKHATCKTRDQRIEAAREVQADPEVEKFGDIQLFEALATDDAVCIWQREGRPAPEILRNYVLGHDARHKQRRFKVPAYRHPDPLRHPVFGDFGNSRWEIEYALHESAKTSAGKRAPDQQRAKWLAERHGLRLGLWDGATLRDTCLRWSSKRLVRDLGLKHQDADRHPPLVARADRLGRAASGAGGGTGARVAGLFELADWNGRLQAPRSQLDALADHVAKHGWDSRARDLRNRLEWLLSFTAKLECRGPFLDYLSGFAEDAPTRPFLSKKSGELAVRHDSNEVRKGLAKVSLARLPGLRIISVDLGHRFAAACAVWESLSLARLKQEINGRTIVAGGLDKRNMFVHTRHRDPTSGKDRTTIYRRVADDVLEGSAHPTAWARLDRQFLIKLQGEDRTPRKCSPEEMRTVISIEKSLGRIRDEKSPLPHAVDELMTEAVRTLRVGLRRLGDAARIAYAFKPGAMKPLPGGGCVPHTLESRAASILDAMMRWNDLADGERWKDEWAANLWRDHLKCELPAVGDDADRWERKRHRGELGKLLSPLATRLAATDTSVLYDKWANRWKRENEKWRPLLKSVRGWILPRGLRARSNETPAQAAARASRRAAARHVGGLSLTRISTIRELYQVQKAYAMRPEPSDLRQNIVARGDARYRGFGRSVLEVMERLREQRVKQIASRIVEGALGVGRQRLPAARERDRQRPQVHTDLPCHAVVIENLRNYRPDELQTRRENRALMSWSSAKIRKYLAEGCQLHGLLLREVLPNYTSRQCSRTGVPGMRCQDVPLEEFLSSPYWDRAVKLSRTRLDGGGTDVLDHMICDLHARWSKAPAEERTLKRTVRVPRAGADLFVAALPPAPRSGTSHHDAPGVQADLNAAANIGLRALLDPDFIGKWWYIPCDAPTGRPARSRCEGAACLDLASALLEPARARTGAGGERSRSMRGAGGGEIVNAWRDIGGAGDWRVHAAYWNDVKARVVHRLRGANGL